MMDLEDFRVPQVLRVLLVFKDLQVQGVFKAKEAFRGLRVTQGLVDLLDPQVLQDPEV
jgi:hypothetical protein